MGFPWDHHSMLLRLVWVELSQSFQHPQRFLPTIHRILQTLAFHHCTDKLAFQLTLPVTYRWWWWAFFLLKSLQIQENVAACSHWSNAHSIEHRRCKNVTLIILLSSNRLLAHDHSIVISAVTFKSSSFWSFFTSGNFFYGKCILLWQEFWKKSLPSFQKGMVQQLQSRRAFMLISALRVWKISTLNEYICMPVI